MTIKASTQVKGQEKATIQGETAKQVASSALVADSMQSIINSLLNAEVERRGI